MKISFLKALLRSVLPEAQAQSLCPTPLAYLRCESQDSPFFQHYHQLLLPVAALIKPSSEGIVIKSSSIDKDSYDTNEFDQFILKSGLDKKNLEVHSHDVFISYQQLQEIRSGKTVEIRVISKAGNYVHNFILKATPSTLATIKKAHS